MATRPAKPASKQAQSKRGSNGVKRRPADTRPAKSPTSKRTATSAASTPRKPTLAYSVRRSSIHGRGVFATRTIRKGADIVEYRGRRISMEAADELPDSDPDNPFHTFLFELNDGRVIDAGRGGNAARWINHSCSPNCEPYEDDEGRVFIAAKRTIKAGEELAYDYKLNVPGRRTPRLLADYACRCGAPRCRGTMVDVKKRSSAPAKR
jgi:SET domain-containing protein